MLKSVLLSLRSEKQSLPNRFTIAMGKQIRSAREEAGLSQSQLAEAMHRHQPAISNIENGKMQADATTLVLLAWALNRPIAHFFPSPYLRDISPELLSPEEQDLLILVRRLSHEDLCRLLAQVRALAEFSSSEATKQ